MTAAGVRLSVRLTRTEGLCWAAGSSLIVLTSLLAALLDVGGTAGSSDQARYHLPTVLTFAANLPSIDVVNVRTSTTPLYHLLLAAPARLFGLDSTEIQVLGSTWAALLLLAVLVITRKTDRVIRVGLVAAVFFSPYVWQASVWLSTDTAALFCGVVSLALIVTGRPSLKMAFMIGVAVAATIAIRQTWAWILAPALLMPFVDTGQRKGTRAAIASLPGATLLISLILSWGSLTPPAFRDFNAGQASPVGFGYGLALWSFYALPFALALKIGIYENAARRYAITAGLVGAAVALVLPSAYSDDGAQRTGGWLWILVEHTGGVLDRSPILVLLAFAGGYSLALLVAAVAQERGRAFSLVIAVAIAGSLAAAASSAQVFQRYYELPMLACLTILVILLAREGGLAERQRSRIGLAPAILQVAALLLVVGAPLARSVLGA